MWYIMVYGLADSHRTRQPGFDTEHGHSRLIFSKVKSLRIIVLLPTGLGSVRCLHATCNAAVVSTERGSEQRRTSGGGAG